MTCGLQLENLEHPGETAPMLLGENLTVCSITLTLRFQKEEDDQDGRSVNDAVVGEISPFRSLTRLRALTLRLHRVLNPAFGTDLNTQLDQWPAFWMFCRAYTFWQVGTRCRRWNWKAKEGDAR